MSDLYFLGFITAFVGFGVYMILADSSAPIGNPFTKIGRAKNRYRKKYKERVAFYIENGHEYFNARIKAKLDIERNGLGS